MPRDQFARGFFKRQRRYAGRLDRMVMVAMKHPGVRSILFDYRSDTALGAPVSHRLIGKDLPMHTALGMLPENLRMPFHILTMGNTLHNWRFVSTLRSSAKPVQGLCGKA